MANAMFAELPDMMHPLSTQFTHHDNGEVYLDADELELGGSRPFHKVSERFQQLPVQYPNT